MLCEAYAQIKGQYVDEITDEELVDAAVRGMIEYGLEDPYSGYLPPTSTARRSTTSPASSAASAPRSGWRTSTTPRTSPRAPS